MASSPVAAMEPYRCLGVDWVFGSEPSCVFGHLVLVCIGTCGWNLGSSPLFSYLDDETEGSFTGTKVWEAMEPLEWQWKAEDDASESAWDGRAVSAGAMPLAQHQEDGQLSLVQVNKSEMDSAISPDG